MGREHHRIGVVRRFNEPVHVACRGPQYCVCQYSRGWKRGLSTANRPPSAEQNCFNGRPNEKTAADFVQQHRAGCFYYIVLLPPPRCRGSPVLVDHKKYRTGECSMWQKNNRWESPKELQYRFTGYLQKAIRRGKAAYQKKSRYLAFHEIPADIGDMRILDEMAPDMLETLPLLMWLDNADLVRHWSILKSGNSVSCLPGCWKSRRLRRSHKDWDCGTRELPQPITVWFKSCGKNCEEICHEF